MFNVPEVINNYRAYKAGNELVGTTGEITLPDIQGITATIEGGGILGNYEVGVAGHFENIQVEIPFRIVNDDMFTIANMNRAQEITLRGSAQSTVKATGNYAATGMRVVFRGRPIAYKPGTLKAGNMMNASITLNVTYYLLEIGGQKKFELDKLNSVYIVDGEDLLAEIRSQC